jgi:hypothetical protein
MRSQISCWLLVLLATYAEAQGVVGSPAPAQPALPSAGVMTGQVVDEAGHPAVGFIVQAVTRRKKWNGPYYEAAIGRPDETDDRGQFRLHSLTPGQYVVAVSMRPRDRESASQTTRGPEYLRTFNPGTTSLEDAQPVAVVAAKEQSVSIALTPARFVSISGTATTSDSAPAAGFDVWLRGGPASVGSIGVRGGFATPMVASARTSQNGSFALSHVSPGSYTLTITNGYTRRGQPLQFIEVPVQVMDTPLVDLEVATASGATVSGQLEWADAGPPPWPSTAKSLGTLRAVAVGHDIDFGSLDTQIKPDGTFEFTNLYGLRRIQSMGLPFYWTIRSVEAPDNLMVGQSLNVRPGSAIAGVKVFVTNQVGMLMATVADEDGKPFLGGSVLLMSPDPAVVDPLGWGYRATQMNYGVGAVSYYTMDRILPGRYLMIAIDVSPSQLTNDADLMERARAAATTIEIHQGQTPVALRLVRLKPFVRDLPPDR